MDFGSGGVLLIPDRALVNWPQLTVGSEKEGGLWFIDRNTPGQYQDVCSSDPCTCTPSGNNPSGNIQTYWTGKPYAGSTIWGGLAYWQMGMPAPSATSTSPPPPLSYIFAGAHHGKLTRYPLCAGPNSSLPICQGTARLSASVSFPTGATPAISASSSTAPDALVWAIGGQVSDQSPLPVTQGVLYAFDAITMQQEYSSSTCSARDTIAPSSKFTVPTVANGYVYVGAQELQNGLNNGQGTFYIFGPNSGTCQ